MLKELYDFSNEYLVSKQRTKFHILDPRYLDLFFNYDINEIEFLNCRYMEYRKSEKSYDAYDQVIKMTYPEIFNQTKRTRYIEVYISSIREIENGRMKSRYYQRQSELSFRKPAFNQMAVIINTALIGKEIYAKDMDYELNRYVKKKAK